MFFSKKKEPEDITERVKELIQLVMDDARNAFGVTLDYSHASIETIEKMLESYHQKFQKEASSDELINLVGTSCGCYVGETLIKNLGFGEWLVPTEGPIAGEWVVNIKGNYCLFPAKAIKRIKNGREDNIVTMYQTAFNTYSDNKISLKLF